MTEGLHFKHPSLLTPPQIYSNTQNCVTPTKDIHSSWKVNIIYNTLIYNLWLRDHPAKYEIIAIK